jgi:hypothetical protein
MASSEVDIGQLSDSQQEVLQQYTAVTNQELEAAIPLLQRSQWNVQVGFYSRHNNIARPDITRLLSQSSLMESKQIQSQKLWQHKMPLLHEPLDKKIFKKVFYMAHHPFWIPHDHRIGLIRLHELSLNVRIK